MKAIQQKTFVITFSFRSNKDLRDLLDQIKKEIRAGEKQVSSCLNGHKYKIQALEDISPANDVEIKSRIEIINGKTCEVIPSIMNYE